MLNKNKKLLYIILILLVVLAVGFYFFSNRKQVVPTSQTGQPTAEEVRKENEANADKKQDLVEQGDTPNIPPATTSKDITITAKQETDNTVTVFTKLLGITNGSCVLAITNGNKSTNNTAKVVYQPEYSTCAGFSVPIDNVGKGSWSIKLSVSSNGQNQESTINFEVK